MNPRITANQVTAVRLLLLPIPVGLLYLGGRPAMLTALGIFVLLGLTDALDGYLARRYGSTPIGALLDPLADKIFLVAGYVPMVDILPVPTTLIVLLFVRELGVTALRTIAFEEGFTFRTSLLAKLKTVVQMAGAGFVILLWLFPADREIFPVLGVAVAGSLVPGAIALLRGGRPGWKSAWSAGLVAGVALLRVALPQIQAIIAVLVVIVGFTLVSGLEYLWDMRRVLVARFRRAPLEALRLLGLASTLPLLFLPALERQGAPTVAILGLLAAELAVGGLDNSLAQIGRLRGPWPDLVRCLLQLGAGVVVLQSVVHSAHPGAGRAAAAAALVVTVLDAAIRFFRNRDVFRGPEPT